MDIRNNLKFINSYQIMTIFDSFPTNPQKGAIVLKSDRFVCLYIRYRIKFI